jgi:hypothetical protein
MVTASRSGRLISVRHDRTDEKILLLDPPRQAPKWGDIRRRQRYSGGCRHMWPIRRTAAVSTKLGRARLPHQVPHEHRGTRRCRISLETKQAPIDARGDRARGRTDGRDLLSGPLRP